MIEQLKLIKKKKTCKRKGTTKKIRLKSDRKKKPTRMKFEKKYPKQK